MSSDGLILTACVMFAVYGMAHTLWGGSSGGGGSFLFGALSVVGLATATLILCWLEKNIFFSFLSSTKHNALSNKSKYYTNNLHVFLKYRKN